MNAADIINIKLMKCGGISQALAIAQYAQKEGKTCMIGCMLEGSISVAAAAHLAAARPTAISLIDLDGPVLGQYDPLHSALVKRSNSSTIFDRALIHLNQSPGLGITQI